MIVLSLALVVAAAVALFIGLLVTTGLTFIYIAIGLCLVSLLLLWLATRSRKGEGPSAPVYGGVRAGTTEAPASPTASPAMASTHEESAPKQVATKKAATRRATRGEAARERLAEIPGVGPAEQEALLARYGSLEAIRDAPVEDIVDNVRGFGQALATRVKDAL